jgi:predicted transcriptional regulator
VIDGREEIARELAASSADVREYVASELRHLLGVQAFVDALSGFLMPDSASQSRRPALLRRLRALAESGLPENGN